MVTELFRLWSTELPFRPVLLAIAGVETTGTAGGIEDLPFSGEMDEDFACCTGATLPTATAGDWEEELVAIGGDETAFFVAEAYD